MAKEENKLKKPRHFPTNVSFYLCGGGPAWQVWEYGVVVRGRLCGGRGGSGGSRRLLLLLLLRLLRQVRLLLELLVDAHVGKVLDVGGNLGERLLQDREKYFFQRFVPKGVCKLASKKQSLGRGFQTFLAEFSKKLFNFSRKFRK